VNTPTAKHLHISGRVQGVGFRQSMCSEAKSLGVTGWVRNRRDGSVEALLQGSPQAVMALTQWARQGPPAARVTSVEVNQINEAGQWDDFQLHPTQ